MNLDKMYWEIPDDLRKQGRNKLTSIYMYHRDRDPGYVYIAKTADPDITKIGKSNDPDRRINDANKSTFQLDTWRLITTKYFTDCRLVERMMHSIYSDHLMSGRRELFRIGDVKYVVATLGAIQ